MTERIAEMMTPAELDLHKFAWRGWKPQKGGWNQVLWIQLQSVWFEAIGRVPA